MLTPQKIKTLIVDCIIRAGRDGCPESHLYIVCGMDMRIWEVVKTVMVESNLLVVKGHYAELTQTAQSMLSECSAQPDQATA